MANQAHPEVLSGAGATEARRWIFGRAVVDERTLELLVDGEEVEIERKPFEVLRFLLQHAGEVVTKDELLAAVWPGRFLSESVLAKAISRLREVLHDPDQELIKTVHGYGYRLVAQVRVEVQHAPATAHFDFKPGDRPPSRPLWSLVRRLGSGGHGEAWLGRHDKTHEQRVFKFAIDEPSLGALKREITLFRFLNDSLGEHARIVTLMDWNLEQPPCFIESEYIAGGSLIEWAERSGGLAKIPLATRIDIAAQIAEALAAVHSVGVLHKDLKPSNVLITAISPLPQAGEGQGEGARSADINLCIHLADFGSGGVLDAKQLEALGITRLGFTKTIAALGGTTGGTPLYLAPELLAGQPPTVKADIYALGVMLYQLVVGEFRKAMAPGWEHEVDDELIRECIADASQGDATRRIADAGALAQRLRTLDEERERRRREREAREKAEALERALREAKASQAVAEFLSKDMFSVVSNKPLRDLTVKELLEAASAKLADRFQDMPAAAAQIHAALGGAFFTMLSHENSERHLDQALTYYERADEAAALSITSQLVLVKAALGKLPHEMPRYQAILSRGESRLGRLDPAILNLRRTLARMRFALLGDWSGAAADFRRLVEDAMVATPVDPKMVGEAEVWLGQAQHYLGAFREAEETLRSAESRLSTFEGSSPLFSFNFAQVLRARCFLDLGRLDEAEAELALAREIVSAWVANPDSEHLLDSQFCLAQVRLRQGRIDEAIRLLEGTIDGWMKASQGREMDITLEHRIWLGRAYREAGRLDAAEASLQRALAIRSFPRTHPFYQIALVELADVARLRKDLAGASRILDAVDGNVLARLGADHPLMADLQRVRGLTALQDGQSGAAREALKQALRIYRARYGECHAFTRRAEAELATVPAETDPPTVRDRD